MQLTRRWGICVRCALVLLGNEFYVETFTTELILAVSHTTVGYKLYLRVRSFITTSPELRHLLSPRKILTSNSLNVGSIIFDGVSYGLIRRREWEARCWCKHRSSWLYVLQRLHDFVSLCLYLDCEDIWSPNDSSIYAISFFWIHFCHTTQFLASCN